MQRPAGRALLFGLAPFVAVCFSVSLWDRVYPLVLGLPFNFFWLVLWLFLGPACMWRAYRIEARRETESRRGQGGEN